MAGMERNTACRIYIGNLDEKVTERVLYEILIQVGYVVDLHMPRDKETNRHKGYAFAEYETEEIAAYAVKLFSGLVRLHNRTLKFAMSEQNKPSQNSGVPVTLQTNSPTLPMPSLVYGHIKEVSQGSAQSPVNCSSTGNRCVSPVYPQASSGGLVNREVNNRNFEYSRRVLGAMFNNANRPGARHPIADQA